MLNRIKRCIPQVGPGLLLLCSSAWAAEPLYVGQDPLLPVAVERGVTLTAAADRPLPLKIFYPESGGPYPLIVLSHGTFSSIDRYDLIADYWAAHGYVVILPQHKDANYGVQPTGYAMMQEVALSRVADMSQVLDELDTIEQQVPALKGRIDRAHPVAAGHSMGTQVAMLLTGMQFRTPYDKQLQASDERRFVALLLVSDPGKMRMMPPDVWRASSVPTFMATGTDDYGLMGERGARTEAQSEVLSNTAAVDRYSLELQNSDHYFGGLIQKQAGAKPDYEGLAIFNAISVAFLDAYIKGSADAKAYLATVDLPQATDQRAALTKVGSE
jgi:predicted dienelactone hydrolase